MKISLRYFTLFYLTVSGFSTETAAAAEQIKLKGVRNPIVSISNTSTSYRLTVDFIAVKAFDESTNIMLNKAKGGAYIQLALANFMKVKPNHILAISGQRTLSHNTRGGKFQLSQQIPKAGIKQQVEALPNQDDNHKTNVQPNAPKIARSTPPKIRGGLLSRKDDLADSIKKYFIESKKVYPNIQLPEKHFHDKLETIMEMTIEFKSRMTEIIKKDRGLFNQEKAELRELVELSFEEIKIGMETLDERYFQMQLEGFK